MLDAAEKYWDSAEVALARKVTVFDAMDCFSRPDCPPRCRDAERLGLSGLSRHRSLQKNTHMINDFAKMPLLGEHPTKNETFM